ncbi:hypothetical protein T265_04719 [Opisthorchis viverrini]|uniref:Uncharacterized protein n=1 Tax=Opisthorchis viverrini TaxID=6198 RepID=A0A074ZM80_OPIVI|nr:hypothetical protein T265_04719 [Opisthorchis viverrini]KER28498.1 hypothetical protein T265_04719 [Opisthorchis viverrini]
MIWKNCGRISGTRNFAYIATDKREEVIGQDTGHKTDLENIGVLRRGLGSTPQTLMAEAVEIAKHPIFNRRCGTGKRMENGFGSVVLTRYKINETVDKYMHFSPVPEVRRDTRKKRLIDNAKYGESACAVEQSNQDRDITQGPRDAVTKDDLADESAEVAYKFVYLGSCVSPGGLAKYDISIRVWEAKATLHHSWHRCNAGLSVKDQVYGAAISSILLYEPETL